MDAAYEMLSDEAQEKIPRVEFERRLPANYQAQTGSSVNAVGGSVGTVVGDSACVDGWLEVPDGMANRYVMGLSEDEDGTMRINTLVLNRCHTP